MERTVSPSLPEAVWTRQDGGMTVHPVTILWLRSAFLVCCMLEPSSFPLNAKDEWDACPSRRGGDEGRFTGEFLGQILARSVGLAQLAPGLSISWRRLHARRTKGLPWAMRCELHEVVAAGKEAYAWAEMSRSMSIFASNSDP